MSFLFAVAMTVGLAVASTAAASNPGRWVLTGASSVPDNYWQGLTSDPSDSQLFFIGPSQGLWQTTPQLVQTAGVSKEIPTAVKQSVGYNHIGDPTWLDGEGGRVVLPMECFNPAADPSNTCGKGAFGVADPGTLAFRYYVQLDPAPPLPLLRAARPAPHPEGDVGRDLAERKAHLDVRGQRPARLPRERRDAG